jgi:O-antigen ligase
MKVFLSSGECMNDAESLSLEKENWQQQLVPTESREHERNDGLTFLFLCLFTIAVFARPEDIFPSLAPLHLTFVFGACAGLTYLAAVLSRRADLLWTRELKIVLLLTGWYIAGVPFALWKHGSLQTLTDVWLKTFLIFFLLTQVLVALERIRKLLWAIILSELVVTSISIFLSSQAIWVGERLLGFNLGILGWNFLGIAEALTIPYIAAIFVVRRSILEASLLGAALISMTWMLVLTASRSGFLDVVFSAVLTSLLVLRGSSRGRIIGLAMALALVVAISLAPQVFWERLGTMWGGDDTTTNEVAASAQESGENHRTVLIQSLQYTFEHPVFGLGLGNFVVANGTDLGVPSAWVGTHNTFTEISSEAGVPALLLFVGLLVTALRNIKKVVKTSANNPEGRELNLIARATQASLLSFAFGALFAHLAYEYFFFYLVGIGVGIQQIAGTMQAISSAPAGDLASTLHMAAAN